MGKICLETLDQNQTQTKTLNFFWFSKKIRSGCNMDPVPPQLAMVVPLNPSNKHMTEKIRNDVYHKLLEISEDGILPHGGITRVAKEFSIHRTGVSRQWKQASAQRVLGWA
jgi:hypothetical protein